MNTDKVPFFKLFIAENQCTRTYQFTHTYFLFSLGGVHVLFSFSADLLYKIKDINRKRKRKRKRKVNVCEFTCST